MPRTARPRPTLADLEHEGPALSPADFAILIGVSRELIGEMCRLREIPAFQVGAGKKIQHWKIPREFCRDYCRSRGLLKPAA